MKRLLRFIRAAVLGTRDHVPQDRPRRVDMSMPMSRSGIYGGYSFYRVPRQRNDAAKRSEAISRGSAPTMHPAPPRKIAAPLRGSQ